MTLDEIEQRYPPRALNDARQKAQAAYEEICEGAPVGIPAWDDLHRVEREHLIRFASALLCREARI